MSVTLNATISWVHSEHFGDHGKREKTADAKICSEQENYENAALEDVAQTEREGFEMSNNFQSVKGLKTPKRLTKVC